MGAIALAIARRRRWRSSARGSCCSRSIFVPLVLLGLYDVTQKRHNILRNYPIAGHLRFLLEAMGPELHQYLVESDEDGRPFNRDARSLIYERAKDVEDKKPFGTELDVYAPGYTWLTHSIATRPMIEDPEKNLRTTIGGPQCKQPYSSSILNISAMSFGALGAPAILRDEHRARSWADFAHDTGEGGISPYHRENGGDLIWQIGTGYFGCRTQDGRLRPRAVRRAGHRPAGQDDRDQALAGRQARVTAASCPGAKVTQEIAETRLVPEGKDVFSPDLPQGVLDAAGDVRVHRAAARAVRRQAGRVQDLHRRPAGVHGDRQGDARDRDLRRLHRRRRRRGRHRSGAAGVLQRDGRAAARGPAGRPERARRRRASASEMRVGASGKIVTAGRSSARWRSAPTGATPPARS